MSDFSRRHYETIAETIKTLSHTSDRWDVANHFANMFAGDNPRFNKDKFLGVITDSFLGSGR